MPEKIQAPKVPIGISTLYARFVNIIGVFFETPIVNKVFLFTRCAKVYRYLRRKVEARCALGFSRGKHVKTYFPFFIFTLTFYLWTDNMLSAQEKMLETKSGSHFVAQMLEFIITL